MPFQSRAFWNPFATTEQKRVSEAVSKIAADHVAQNEKLVDASLEILNCSSSLEMSPEEYECVNQVVNMLFQDFSMKPAHQFDLVFAAMRLPAVQSAGDSLVEPFFVVLESILPDKLFAVFVEVKELTRLQEPRQVFLVRRLVHFLLGDLDLFIEEGADGDIEVDDVFTSFAVDVPVVACAQSFTTLKASASEMVLKARLFSLLSDVCASFDPHKTGKIPLQEFKDSLVRVMGPEEAKLLLDGVQPDAQGLVRYHQVTSMLTKPPRAKDNNMSS